MYDFVLFENFYLAKNHYKDLCLLARLLRDCGYLVAIADVFQECKQCSVEGVPHIVFDKDPRDYKLSLSKHLTRYLQNTVNRIRVNQRIRYSLKCLRGQYRNMYAGSYHNEIRVNWLKLIPNNSNIFFWGLRSSRLYEYRFNHSIYGINSYFVRRYIEKRSRFKFIVSNEIIKEEFIREGIDANRLLVRPERVIEAASLINKEERKQGPLKILSIGMFRPTKRIERIVMAIKQSKRRDIRYIIAGKSDVYTEYENIIYKAIFGMDNVIRINRFLSEEEYQSLLKECDYLILCDAQEESSVTNGTMMEALLYGKPIIAPNYDPYVYYIEKYKIGKYYDPENLCQLVEIIDSLEPPSCFSDSIKAYIKKLEYPFVLTDFSKQVKRLCSM